MDRSDLLDNPLQLPNHQQSNGVNRPLDHQPARISGLFGSGGGTGGGCSATRLLAKGVSVENVAALLGNSPKIVWKHYSAWIPARQQALDEAMQAANGWHHLEANRKPSSKPSKKAVKIHV